MKKIFETTNLTIYIISALAIFLMLNWLSFRHWKRFDLTKNKIYSLSDESKKVLKNLNKELQIYVLFDEADAIYDELNELLKRYENLSKNIKVKYIEPGKNRLEAQRLIEELGINQVNSIVVKSEDRKKFIYGTELAEYDYTGMQWGQPPRLKSFKGEEAITSAILNVSEPKQVKIGFIKGHNEYSIEEYDENGLSEAKEILNKRNYNVEEISLLNLTEIPSDYSVLISVSPKYPPLPNEIEIIEKFIEKGGSFFLCLDPNFDQINKKISPSGFEEILKKYGIEIKQVLVIDPKKAIPFVGPGYLYLDSFRFHKITDKMNKTPVLFPLSIGFGTLEPEIKDYKTHILLETSDEAWGETNIGLLLKEGKISKDEKDIRGPLQISVISENKGKVLVVGDGDFCTNSQIKNLGNSAFFQNAVHYLAQKEEMISIPPKQVERVAITLNRKQMRTIFIVIIIILPMISIISGILIYRLRRK